MKRRNHQVVICITLMLFLTAATGFADAYTDFGSDLELVVIETPYAEAETNSASSVTTIDSEQIASYKAETVAELINRAIGTTFSSYGALGAAQHVQIRGAASDKTLVFLNGVLLGSAHEGAYDISQIPLSIIERIEIIKSGPGNLGRTNAIGGMVHIITKEQDAASPVYPFTLSMENGSFMPQSYDSGQRNWASLIDSQKVDVGYTASVGPLAIHTSVGAIRGANAFTYVDNGSRTMRTNAQMWGAHGSVLLSGDLFSRVHYDGHTLVTFRQTGVPGSLSWLSDTAEQGDLQLISGHAFTIASKTSHMLQEQVLRVQGTFGRTHYQDPDWLTDDTHDKIRLYAQYDQQWELSEHFALSTGIDAEADHVQSTKIGTISRITPSLYLHGGVYFSEGSLSLHPSVQVQYVSDTAVFSSNASLGMLYGVSESSVVRANISYAEQVPTFSQLYWPEEWGYEGNPDLKTEKGINGDLGVTIEQRSLRYEGSVFMRRVTDAITGDPENYYIPINIAQALFLGTEQTITYSPSEILAFNLSYQYNRSFDLSGSNTLSDDIPISSVRTHTAKGSVSFTPSQYELTLHGEYLGASAVGDAVFLMNLTASLTVSERIESYLAIDNLLNTSYELYTGYPMPGMKIRMGTSIRF